MHSSSNHVQQTLIFIKPDGFEDSNVGKVITELESNKFQIVGMKMRHLKQDEAERFYAVHKERPFFKDLVTYVTRGPILAVALRGENAVARVRDLMGATNPKDAAKTTIRGKFGKSLDANVIHGSDSIENAEKEIPFFFSKLELLD